MESRKETNNWNVEKCYARYQIQCIPRYWQQQFDEYPWL